MNDKPQNPRNPEDMTTTASFVLTIGQVMWIRDEAARRGLNNSELVRELLEQAKARALTADRSAA